MFYKFTYIVVNIIRLFFLSAFLISCGLDNIVYLVPPRFIRLAESEQDSEQYIQFETTDVENSSDVYYRGFDVLYRIYATKDELNNSVSAIKSYNSSNPQNSAIYALETKKYQRLRRKDGASPLIPNGAVNRLVRIRLYNYGTPPSIEQAGLYIANLPPATPISQVTRFNDLDFKGNIPNVETDDDIEKTNNKDEYQFVAFFAVTTGLDEQFVALYSELLYLGYLNLQK